MAAPDVCQVAAVTLVPSAMRPTRPADTAAQGPAAKVEQSNTRQWPLLAALTSRLLPPAAEKASAATLVSGAWPVHTMGSGLAARASTSLRGGHKT